MGEGGGVASGLGALDGDGRGAGTFNSVVDSFSTEAVAD